VALPSALVVVLAEGQRDEWGWGCGARRNPMLPPNVLWLA
jgi:hypothetical protein